MQSILRSMILDVLFPQERIVLEDVLPLVKPRAVGAATALLPYRNRRVQQLIKRTKFGNSKESARVLGAVLKQHLDGLNLPGLVIVPIPLHPIRRMLRGYNQVERIALYTGYPISKALKRVKYTKPQARQDRVHRKDLVGAFILTEPCTGTIVLLDDVVTTGRTFEGALAAMPDMSVYPLALAH